MKKLVTACAIAAAAVSGCGDESQELPDGVAAKVRNHAITQEAVDRAMVGQLALKHSAQSMPAYMPADIDGCVASFEDRPGSKGVDSDELRQRCEQARDRQEDAALRLLIKGRWYLLDAERQGIANPVNGKAAAQVAAHAGVKTRFVRDVVEGVQLQYLIGTRLAERNQGGNLEKLIARYNDRLRSEYQDDTICSEDHEVPECG
jgi:hypothetical protein